MSKEQYIQEDEIDLRKLVNIILPKKKFILIVTFLIVLLSMIYVLFKPPVYQVKSVVRIGYIDNKLLDDSKIIEKKLRIIFNVDNKNLQSDILVKDIKTVKKVENFLEIITEGRDNEIAIKKNKEVIEFIKNEYKQKINQEIYKTKLSIKNIKKEIYYFERIEKTNLEFQIKKVKTQTIANIDREIRLIKEQKLPNLYNEMAFFKTTILNSIENKLKFNNSKLKEYEESIKKISTINSDNDTQNMLMSMQLLNTQNLVLNLQNKIEDLNTKKETILNSDLTDIEIKIKNLKDITLKELEIKKQNIIQELLNKLKVELEINLVNKISNLKEKIKQLENKLVDGSIKNSEIVGEIIVNDSPIKPKKKLIILVSFIAGLILSIFLVFFINFIQNLKKEEK
ncbi:GNVR domain-containing protein [Arcobacter sp. LA11]|uniref:GNVR domain-containing protein n=1 Tax=Arcobacter sp. LA11 TaxID=1898176 RepID=UPI000932413D|nr:GNVR domain-containing protein [Arcobacter sp. LA11]